MELVYAGLREPVPTAGVRVPIRNITYLKPLILKGFRLIFCKYHSNTIIGKHLKIFILLSSSNLLKIIYTFNVISIFYDLK